MSNRVSANTKKIESVSLKNYTSSNVYTFPYDGYVTVSSEQNTSGYIRIILLDPKGGILGYKYMNITNSYQCESIYVKKGMTFYVFEVNVSKDYFVYFNPIL